MPFAASGRCHRRAERPLCCVSVEVRDNRERSRYEALADGELAGYAKYRLYGNRLTIPHTEVEPEHEGEGIGGKLAAFALDDARARGLAVVPLCPFLASYIKRHQEYLDVVDPAMRARVTAPD